MSRSHANRAARLLIVGLALTSLTACLDDGLPWGTLEATMEASFDPSAGRLDDDGRLKTTQNYVVALDELTVAFDSFTLILAAGGAASFDPSNPPEGYSLCHNGHCHADSGELVDYEDIALEMAGASGGGRFAVGLDGEPWPLDSTAVAVSVTPCDPAPCQLPKGDLASLELIVRSVDVKGTVYDTLTGEAARLPEEGLALDVSAPVMTPLNAQLEGTIGRGEPVGVDLSIAFEFPAEVFDDINFGVAPPTDTAAWEALLGQALVDHALLSVSLSRFDG